MSRELQPESSDEAPRMRVSLRVLRRSATEPPHAGRFDQFELELPDTATVADALLKVQVDPVTRDGRVTSPPAFDADCLDETCGSCTLRVNGRVRLGCATRLRDVCEKGRVLHLEPLAKFPLIRDLVVDRSRMRAALEETRAWIEVDARRARKLAVSELASEDELIPLGRCMSCGACLEACPEYGEHSDFVGAAALNRVQLLNSHPNGGFDRALRIESAMAPGGISGCRKAQNCVEVCPVSVPLVDSLQRLSRSTTKRLFAWLFE